MRSITKTFRLRAKLCSIRLRGERAARLQAHERIFAKKLDEPPKVIEIKRKEIIEL